MADPHWDDSGLAWDDGFTLWDGGQMSAWVEQPAATGTWAEESAVTGVWTEQPKP